MKFNKGTYYLEVRRITFNLINDIRKKNPSIANNNEAIKDASFELIHDIVDKHNFTSTFDNALSVIYHSNSTEEFDKNHGVEILEDALKDGGTDSMMRMMAYRTMVNDVCSDVNEELQYPLKKISWYIKPFSILGDGFIVLIKLKCRQTLIICYNKIVHFNL